MNTTFSLYVACKNSICEFDFEILKNSLFKRKLDFVMWNEHLFNLCPAEYAEDFLLCLFKVDCQAHQLAHIDHPLIMNEEQEYHGEGVMCSVCEEALAPSSPAGKATISLLKMRLWQEFCSPLLFLGIWRYQMCSSTVHFWTWRSGTSNYLSSFSWRLPVLLAKHEALICWRLLPADVTSVAFLHSANPVSENFPCV